MKTKTYALILLVFILCGINKNCLARCVDTSRIGLVVYPTGLVLDSMNNEVQLAFKDGRPAYYFCPIFTPVCNTGECLPVFVNIYWNLAGHYLCYNQPPGEILTKADHVPFSESDYTLLDEILRGPDPRFGYGLPSPSEGAKHNKSDNQSSPAPAVQSIRQISKYEMVDGVTGATAIQHSAKFVPGALYTTYTLWGLANDSRYAIMEYSRQNLLTGENLEYLLLHPELSLQSYALAKYLGEISEPHQRAEKLMGIIDTASVSTSKVLLEYVYYNEFGLDTSIHVLSRKFFSTTDIDLKKQILQKWMWYFISQPTMLQLAESLSENQTLFIEIMNTLMYKSSWPDGLVQALILEMENLDKINQSYILLSLSARKQYLNQTERDLLKEAEKKYK